MIYEGSEANSKSHQTLQTVINKYVRNMGNIRKTVQFLVVLYKWPLLEPKMFNVNGWDIYGREKHTH